MRWAWHAFFNRYDVLLTPIMPTSAFPHDHRAVRRTHDRRRRRQTSVLRTGFLGGPRRRQLSAGHDRPDGARCAGSADRRADRRPRIRRPRDDRSGADSRATRLRVHARRPVIDPMPADRAVAEAHPNIALVKYWGKRDGPDGGSKTFRPRRRCRSRWRQLRTRTRVSFDAAATHEVAQHRVTLNGDHRKRRENRRVHRPARRARVAPVPPAAHRHGQQLSNRGGPRVLRIGLRRAGQGDGCGARSAHDRRRTSRSKRGARRLRRLVRCMAAS